MRFFLTMVVISVVCNGSLGILIYLINPVRRVNRCFLVLSGVVLLWLCTLFAGAVTKDPDLLLMWIRLASVTATLIPAAFDALRFAIVSPVRSWRSFLPDLLIWLLMLCAVAVLCQTSFFVYGHEQGPTGFVYAQYGPGQFLYLGYWILALALLIYRFIQGARHATGMARTELGFMFFAAASSLGMGVLTAQVLPYVTGNPSTPQVTPFVSTLLMMGIVGYGIATRRIMSVGSVLQRVTAYAVLLVYLSAMYFLSYSAVKLVFENIGWDVTFFPGLVASVAVALSVIPMRGWMKRVVNLLFVTMESMDVAGMMRQAHHAVLALGTREDLARQFARILSEAAGPSHVGVLLREESCFTSVFASAIDERMAELTLPSDDPLVRVVEEESMPVTCEILRRSRPTPMRTAALDALVEIDSNVVMGVHAQGGLAGIVLMGRRLSGQIYSAEELDALQIICDQLAVAIENSKLYTQVQDARIYHETLINALGSGIVSVDRAGVVTVFNREAERVTGLRAMEVIGRNVTQLPEPLRSELDRMLQSGMAVPEHESVIPRPGRDPVPVRMGGTVFEGHRGGCLGVLLAFQDIELLRRLEEQVRRNDRLSSLGTLSAGMAHEIKNPLVTIKTFTQLLPERHGDEEFRDTFFDLVGQEVMRIDSIVNRLLNFARPAKAELRPVHLHEVVSHALKLVEHPLRAKRISQVLELDAARDRVRGDQELLIQVLINLLLNAIEAMPGAGTLTLTTRNTRVLPIHEANSHDGGPGPGIRLSVRDSGCGIAPDDLPHIFDPFFTRTASGTGLGLSIVHGIIQEHLSTIEVESKPGDGTTFHIVLPIYDEQEEQE